MKIMKTLREIREGKNLTQREAAKRSGISEEHWHVIEKRKHSPTLTTLRKIARGLGVEITDLINAQEEKEVEVA